jgi:hypothetical protein
MSKYPHPRSDSASQNMAPDENLTLCNNCDNYCMRKWHGGSWAWCTVHQNWINQKWVACDSHTPTSLLRYALRGEPYGGGRGNNPMPPYMVRGYELVKEGAR